MGLLKEMVFASPLSEGLGLRGYEIAFSDEMGLANPVYGIWHEPQATFLLTDRFLSKYSSFPSNSIYLIAVGFPDWLIICPTAPANARFVRRKCV